MELIAKIERGDTKSFMISMLLFSGLVTGSLLLFFFLDPFFCEIWEERSGWYLDEYRTGGAKIWRMLYRTTSHWQLTVWLPILWGVSAYCVQRGFEQEKSKIINRTHSLVLLIVAGLAFFAFTGLIFMPLIR
jgi:hypothetical protein